MSEIDDLLRIANRGHEQISGVAKFWVFFALGSTGFAVLIILLAGLASIFSR